MKDVRTTVINATGLLINIVRQANSNGDRGNVVLSVKFLTVQDLVIGAKTAQLQPAAFG